ncbi:hypothetical protein ACFE04_020542 [Oxalis oulophora]
MSVQVQYTPSPVPHAVATPNWTINVSDNGYACCFLFEFIELVNLVFGYGVERLLHSDIRTLKVSNISLTASGRDIRQFFSFSGDIAYVEMRRESETTQLAYVTFKDCQGADTAMLLSGATIGDQYISIMPVEDYELPPDAIQPTSEKKQAAFQKAEDVMSTMLAKGYVLGKDAIKKAKDFDKRHQLTMNASATVASIDQKMGLAEKLSIGTAVVGEKMREVDELFQVSEITKSAFWAAEQKASALMSNRYVSVGASWLSAAFNVVSKAAQDVGTMTKEKVEKAEEEKRGFVYKDRSGILNHYAYTHHLDDSAADSRVVPVDSSDSRLAII